ncbi:hypothetical protein FRUB_04037 [Fimbriiglobus ruber]|uniref:Uncharacterized protein n=1 Tax=Fimbriiglobus ruber TaxID=1908690 RepID=A0A225DXK4_9BACT|nr:hypothetical protein FRUB_04037 [Fimbriiglobus ruber]
MSHGCYPGVTRGARAGPGSRRGEQIRLPTPALTGSGSEGVISARPSGAGTPGDTQVCIAGPARNGIAGSGASNADGRPAGANAPAGRPCESRR